MFLPPFAEIEPVDESEPSTFIAFSSDPVRLLYRRSVCVTAALCTRSKAAPAVGLWHKGRLQIASPSDPTCLREK